MLSDRSGHPLPDDLDERYRALLAAANPLERLAAVVDFAVFRGDLETALARSERSEVMGWMAPLTASRSANLVSSRITSSGSHP